MSSSSTSPQWKTDVFVTFGEGDVIRTFKSNLFKRLNQVGINYFEHDHTEGAGLEMANCLKAIPEVRLALIVFSTIYVNSTPRLEELVEILNCTWDPELVVIPIFYKDGANVSQFARDALAAAKKISGHYELKAANSELKLIDKIVERLVNQIHSRYSGKDFTFGPFGGKGQNNWISADIMGIDVGYGYFIESIAFEVDEDTPTEPQNDGESIFKVKLKNGEYISSFAGHFKRTETGGIGINSLTFRTNKRILGPINRKKEEEEEYFYVPSKAGKVVEFYWRTNNGFLESIGASVKLHSEEINLFKSVGLFGLARGSKWGYESYHGQRTNARNIIVRVDSSGERLIRSITFQYEEENEEEMHGGNGGEEASFELGQQEYLTSVSGYYTDAGIRSLTFVTNKDRTKTMGDEKEGTRFSSPARNGKIVGFYGWSDEYLRGIGAYVEPEPFEGKNFWNDGKFDGVREIHILFQPDIRSIKFVYDNGSEEGGIFDHRCCTNGVSPKEANIKLDYPREYLTSVSVYKQEDGAIQALTFYSNKKGSDGIYGPFGKATGEHFLYPSTGSRIIGFYGTRGKTLKSLGVYAEPMPHMYPYKTIGPFGGGSGGQEWDDGVHSDVRGFRVIEGRRGSTSEIASITFMYDNNGSLVEGSPHGREGASSVEWKMLDYPRERLTEINGFARRIGTDTTIHDLEIITTCTTYHYAYTGDSDNVRRKSTGFKIPDKLDNDGRIVGFFGREGTSNLISIGAHLEYN